jgi:hypothetical protein
MNNYKKMVPKIGQNIWKNGGVIWKFKKSNGIKNLMKSTKKLQLGYE